MKVIDNFHLNVVVANIYSMQNLFTQSLGDEVSNECLKKNFINLMKILIPFIPHLANECLEHLGETEINDWPKINNELILDEKVKIAIQINGKTKQIIEVKKDLNEKNAINESRKSEKIKKNLTDKKILKTIFIKNKIINYVIK